MSSIRDKIDFSTGSEYDESGFITQTEKRTLNTEEESKVREEILNHVSADERGKEKEQNMADYSEYTKLMENLEEAWEDLG